MQKLKIKRVSHTLMHPPRAKQVAAYARVSNPKDAMLHSLSAQVSYYSQCIQEHNGWDYAGVYVDEGISGTTEERPGFQRMLDDTRAGKIDLILTKSISRFARNTVTLLNSARKLKDLGVAVYFEREKIDSLTADGELMLTLLASFAQEESRSVSNNMKWSIRKGYEEGSLKQVRRMYGYDVTCGKVMVIPEEARVVREIFERSASGELPSSICQELNGRGIKTLQGKNWQVNRLNYVLSNIFYTGNVLLQRYFVKDHMDRKQVRNKGELPMYYIDNNHEAIVSQELFDQAAAKRQSRSHKEQADTKQAFSGRIICGECGANYNRKYDRGVHKWICSTYKREGPTGCASKQIPEQTLRVVSSEFLQQDSFDDSEIDTRVKTITAYNGNRLIFNLADGQTVERIWQDRSRSESWTPEMRQAAGEKTKERCHG